MDDIIEIIESIEKTQDEKTILDFDNMKVAKEYFICKFTYCDHMTSKNLFEFQDPTCSSTSRIEEYDEDDPLYKKFLLTLNHTRDSTTRNI